MGLTYKPVSLSGFPFDFVSAFIDKGYSTCVETGTHKGITTLVLAKQFQQVFTIEAADVLYKEALIRFESSANITALLGNSKEKLQDVLVQIKTAKCVFWLDAHYSGGTTFENDCPLIDELRTINSSELDDPIIVIDDARFILAKIGHESRYAELPDFIDMLHSSNRYISHVDDKFIAVPYHFKEQLDKYTQQMAEQDLLFLEDYKKNIKFLKKYKKSFWFRLKHIFDK